MSWLSIIVATGTLAVALVAAWDSWGKYTAQEPGWKVTCIVAVGGLVVSILATVNGWVSEADAAKARIRIDVAEKTAKDAIHTAKQEAADLKGEIARRDLNIRSLDTDPLKTFNGVEVSIEHRPGDEPAKVAKELRALLIVANWKVLEVSETEDDLGAGVIVSRTQLSDVKKGEGELDAAEALVAMLDHHIKVGGLGKTENQVRQLRVYVGESERLAPPQSHREVTPEGGIRNFQDNFVELPPSKPGGKPRTVRLKPENFFGTAGTYVVVSNAIIEKFAVGELIDSTVALTNKGSVPITITGDVRQFFFVRPGGSIEATLDEILKLPIEKELSYGVAPNTEFNLPASHAPAVAKGLHEAVFKGWDNKREGAVMWVAGRITFRDAKETHVRRYLYWYDATRKDPGLVLGREGWNRIE
jgi:hypothetical protein